MKIKKHLKDITMKEIYDECNSHTNCVACPFVVCDNSTHCYFNEMICKSKLDLNKEFIIENDNK